MKYLQYRLTTTEPMMGTASANPQLHEEYIASKAPDAASREEEVEALGVDVVYEKGMTVFPHDEQGRPFIWDYQIKGFFKDACKSLRRNPGFKSKDCKAYKQIIDGSIFVYPRRILIRNAGEIGICQRPLRGSTPQGERVTLASSEEVPDGATLVFTVELLNPADEGLVREWIEFYGRRRGLGQWRNSGKGRFDFELLHEWTDAEGDETLYS